MKILHTCALLVSLLMTTTIYSQTSIPGGDVTGTWGLPGSPYEINGDIIVQSGQTLSIEPGVNVVFMNEYSLTILGDVQAIGNETGSIRFTIADTTGFSSGSYIGWNGIQIDVASDTSRFNYCTIEFSKSNGILSDNSVIEIENCIIENNLGRGIYSQAFSTLSIDSSKISKNMDGGIYCLDSEMNISRSLIVSNTSLTQGGALAAVDSSQITMNFVTISQNSAISGGAIDLIENPLKDLIVDVSNSIIWGNSAPSFSGQITELIINYSNIEGNFIGTGNINEPPGFENSTTDDFNLSWDNFPANDNTKSACIDSGDPTSPKDADSTRADIGAHPYFQVHTALQAGDISGTLFCANSPYYVFGDLTVSLGQELVIEPCVNLIFQGDYRLNVEGRLLAQGNESTIINIRSSNAEEDWQGVRFYDQNTNGQDSSYLSYCNFSYGNADGLGEDAKGGALYFFNSSEVGISNLNILDCSATENGGGMYCSPNSNLVLSNVNISNNIAFNGGGLYCDSANIQIVNSSFTGNQAQYGAGLYSWKSILNIDNTQFDSNDSDFDGGGMTISDGSNCVILNSVIQNSNTGEFGGGIDIDNSQLEITNSHLLINEAQNGGAISARGGSTLTVNTCSIENNLAHTDGAGLILQNYSTVDFDNCIISNNETFDDGGAIYAKTYSDIIINNSEISNNSAFDKGGAIFLFDKATLIADHTLIVKNVATDIGGGLYMLPSTSVDLTHVTMSNNGDIGQGGAIYNQAGTVSANNSIIWGNTEPEINIVSGNYEFNYSVVPGTYTGINLIHKDPLFNDTSMSDYRLRWDNFPLNDTLKSPCIDSGDPNSPADPDTTIADLGWIYFNQYKFAPVITSIVDVPNDQGKQVVLTWDKSPLDHIDIQEITQYKIWRMQNWAKTPMEYVGSVPAHYYNEYAFIAPTISDSTAAGVPYYSYLVSAETENTFIFYNSVADMGYSVDNLAPEPPAGLEGQNAGIQNNLYWEESSDADFHHFALYRSIDPNTFENTPITTVSETSYSDLDLISDTLYYKLTAFDHNGNESSSSQIIEITSGKSLNLKLFLEGPFFVSQMIPFLNLGDYIPLSQPYNLPPWNYVGTETVDHIPNGDIIDWILLEFRDAANASTAVGSTSIHKVAAFLTKDGNIVGLDGINPPKLSFSYNQNLYLVVWHRNHLGIISSSPVADIDGALSYDFSDSVDKIYGGEKASILLNNGIWGLISADANADGQVDNIDKNDFWLMQILNSNYLNGDFNMDGLVNDTDKQTWNINAGKSGFVPE